MPWIFLEDKGSQGTDDPAQYTMASKMVRLGLQAETAWGDVFLGQDIVNVVPCGVAKCQPNLKN
jgi:hypothetical protein